MRTSFGMHHVMCDLLGAQHVVWLLVQSTVVVAWLPEDVDIPPTHQLWDKPFQIFARVLRLGAQSVVRMRGAHLL